MRSLLVARILWFLPVVSSSSSSVCAPGRHAHFVKPLARPALTVGGDEPLKAKAMARVEHLEQDDMRSRALQEIQANARGPARIFLNQNGFGRRAGEDVAAARGGVERLDAQNFGPRLLLWR